LPFSPTDTIVAIATPAGRGGLGVVRISGPGAHAIAQQLTNRTEDFAPRHATLTVVGDRTATPDQAIVTYFPAPHSYTGDDLVEISVHGSPIVLASIVSGAVDLGGRAAGPGEFTLRAFVNGRIDLPKAEAVGDLIDAVTPLQARVAFDQLNGTLTQSIAAVHGVLFDLIARLEASVDFPDEGYHFIEPPQLAAAISDIVQRLDRLIADGRRGRLVREGLQIAIVGAPNVGKSSLFNALLGAARAIVTEIPGTTRDLISETVDFDGLRVTLIDTAGLRETDDRVEVEGMRRTQGAADVADLILEVFDGSQPLASSVDISGQTTDNKRLAVSNKSDIGRAWHHQDAVAVSATTGAGLDVLRARIRERLGIGIESERPAITNIRHLDLLESARAALVRGAAAAQQHEALSEEFVLADLQDARARLEEITGARTTDDVLAHIFSRFCIGK
jgi:tRNA modification GTPase